MDHDRVRTHDEGYETPAGARTPAAGAPARRAVALLLRAALVLVVVLAVVQAQAAGTYLVSTGSVTFSLRPAWPGGQLVLPLGPAGELSLRTHRTPVDVVMEYQLPAQTDAVIEGSSASELPRRPPSGTRGWRLACLRSSRSCARSAVAATRATD